METIPYSHLQKGTFLIATPDIDSGFFFRAVVLLCEHSPSGSFGIVINKTLDLELPEEILTIKQLTTPQVGIRSGGPVQTNQMMILHSSDKIPDQTIQICPGAYLGGDLPFLQESLSSDSPPEILLCFGYVGWQAGQLEREFLDGQWFLAPASAKNIFETAPDNLWATLLRELGGKYASLSMIPQDLSVN